MLSRTYLESQPHWQATFIPHRRRDIRLCLMRKQRGGFYWHQPEYAGLSPAGATFECSSMNSIRQDIESGLLKLSSGTLPPELDKPQNVK